MVSEVKTEHPHIVKNPDIRGGRPIIQGTSIEVVLIIKLHKMGESPDDIMSSYPHLSPAAVYDALSYYLDHQQEIEKLIAQQQLDYVLKRNNLTMDKDGRIRPAGK